MNPGVYTKEIDLSYIYILYNHETGKYYHNEEEMINNIRRQRLENILENKNIIIEDKSENLIRSFMIGYDQLTNKPAEVLTVQQFKELFVKIKF